ncbi:MAG: DinB family protein [Chloroflexota bacterium]|nr:MAG: DinB family protein [Chloroflexota bacterium]
MWSRARARAPSWPGPRSSGSRSSMPTGSARCSRERRMTSPNPGPDPTAAVEAYRQSLLAALGADDPAEVQAQTPATLQALVLDAGPALRIRPKPGEWSALECIGHIVDGELVVAGRYRWILAHDEPEIIGYDQALWVDRLRHQDADVGHLLDLFEALRASNLELWSRLSVAERARVGMHSERGPESIELTFRLAAGHDRIHLAQARRALDAAGRRDAMRGRDAARG